MDEGKLTKWFWHETGDVPGPTPFCPEDRLIAAYFEGASGALERQQFKNHLVSCRFCQARLGNLERSDVTPAPIVAADVLADAKQLVRPSSSRRASWRTPAWVAAAAVTLALVLIYGGQPENSADRKITGSPDAMAEYESRQLRSLGRARRGIEIINPAPGTTLVPGATVQWAEVAGSDHYDVILLSATGDVVWTERRSAANWSPRGSQGLIDGRKYYLRVEAALSDGSILSSRHVDFRFAER